MKQLKIYIQRLEKLEEMAKSFDGVERVFAIQAGREIRIVVNLIKLMMLQVIRLHVILRQKLKMN